MAIEERKSGTIARIGVFACAAALVCSTLLAGCAQEAPQQNTTSSSSESSQPQEAGVISIGKATDTTKNFTLKNDLDAPVIAVVLSAAGVSPQPLSDMSGGAVWAAGEKARINYEPAGQMGLYDVSISCKDGTVYNLHDVELDKLGDSAIVSVSDGVAYLTYTTENNVAVNTLEAERDIAIRIAADMRAAEGQTAPATVAAGESQTAPVESTGSGDQAASVTETYPSQTSLTYTYPAETYPSDTDTAYGSSADTGYSYDTGSTAADTGAGNSSQSADNCVEGGVVLR